MSGAVPAVSVIVPAYNAVGSVAAAIATVQQQTEPDVEIIVVDDASRDDTVGTVRALAAEDPRIVLIQAKRNGGPGAARNLGLARARGAWIAPLDADDAYRPERLALLRGLGEGSGADLVADNLLLVGDGIDGEARLIDARALPAARWLGATEFVEGNMGKPGRTPRTLGFLKPIFRTHFLRARALQFREARFGEDYLFYLDCLMHGGRWLLTPEAMYVYVQRAGSLTRSHDAADLADLVAAEREMLARPTLATDPVLAAAIRQHCHSVELALIWFRFVSALKRGDWRGAGGDLFRSRQSVAHIARQGLRALPRVAVKAYGRRRVRPA